MPQVKWHSFGIPPGCSLVAVWEFRVLLPRAFERRRDERQYHAEDEVGHDNYASHATIRARPMGGEVPDGRGGELSTDDCGHAR